MLLDKRFSLFQKMIEAGIKIFNRDTAQVFMFHSVDNSNGEFSISPENFKEFISQISINRQPEFISGLFEEIGTKKEKVYFTFDDVYESVYINALPILIEYQIPFSIFPTTNLIETKGYLSKRELIELSQNPLCTVGSHAVSHVPFRKLSRKQKEIELYDSKRILEDIIEKEVDCIAYPYGSIWAIDKETVNMVKAVGYKMAFSTLQVSVPAQIESMRYFIPRISISNENYNIAML